MDTEKFSKEDLDLAAATGRLVGGLISLGFMVVCFGVAWIVDWQFKAEPSIYIIAGLAYLISLFMLMAEALGKISAIEKIKKFQQRWNR